MSDLIDSRKCVLGFQCEGSLGLAGKAKVRMRKNSRSHPVNPYPHRVQLRQRPNKPTNSMFTSHIHRRGETRCLARNTANMHHPLRIRERRFADSAVGRRVQPAGYGELGAADGVREVDVEECVVAYSRGRVGGVFGVGGAGWVPEVCPVRFEDACSGADLGREAISDGVVLDG